MDNTELNLNFLKGKYGHIYRFLQNHSDLLPEQRVTMDNGLGNVLVSRGTSNEYYLYERENTLFQLALWIQSVGEQLQQHDHILLYGFGLGYHLRLLLEHYPNKWFYVYEPHLSVFYTALSTEKLSEVLNHPNVKAFAIGDSLEQKRQLIYPIITLAGGSFSLVSIPAYQKYEIDDIQNLKKQLPEITSEYQVNQNTKVRFKDIWMLNRLNHLATNLTSTSISKLRGLFSDTPALIVGSGPSLQQDIEVIRKLKDHCLIVAAGSSIQALLHQGIFPHLVVIADGGRVMENIFRNIKSPEIPVLYTPTTNYRVTDDMNAPKFYSFSDTDPITNYFMDWDTETPAFRSVASVSGFALQASVYLGCREIALAGQDFSFPEERHYADGVEHVGEQYIKKTVSAADVLVENVSGGMNRTTLPYKVLQNNMEEMIANFQGIRFINTSKVGAKISGTEWMRAEELLEMWESVPKVDSSILQNTISEQKQGFNDNQAKQVLTKLTGVLNDLELMSKELRNLQRQLAKLAELSRKNPVKCSNSMITIEEKWSSIVNDSLFSVFFEQLLPSELQFFDGHLSLIVEERNLIKKASYFEIYLGKIIEEMLNEVPKLEKLLDASLERVQRLFP